MESKGFPKPLVACSSHARASIQRDDFRIAPVLPAGFWQRVTILPDGCWQWGGATWGLPGYPYGQLRVGKSRIGAHRYAYLVVRGEIPQGFEPDHLCRNTLCVNPWHLEIVTHRENAWRRSTTYTTRPNPEEIVQLHRNGLSIRQISDETGVRYLNVWRIVRGGRVRKESSHD